jgi:hypothetical protein
MQKFVRGNDIVCSGSFLPATGAAQPSAAYAILTYPDATTGGTVSSTITLSEDGSGVWSGVWDSLLSKEGEVYWRIQASVGLQAAAEGRFYLLANSANTIALDP